MVKKIDSDALGILTKSLGLSGAGSPVTELTDGVVDQALSINEVVRRSRTQAGTGGIYTAVTRHVHTGATVIFSSIAPYNISSTLARPPWPTPMPVQFDIWLLGAALNIASGSGAISAAIGLQYDPAQRGWGVNDSGNLVTVTSTPRLAFWTSFVSALQGMGILASVGQPYQPIRMRLPRSDNTLLTFGTVSAADIEMDFEMLLGVFPVALGQDGLL